MPNKRRILYLIHIDWNWIKQRPQFLAEELSAYFDVFVIYPFTYRNRSRLVKNVSSARRIAFFALPFTRLSWVRLANDALLRLFARILGTLFKPDIVYVTSPMLGQAAMAAARGKSKIIYDCMDDVLEFSIFRWSRKRLADEETGLIESAGAAVTSSHTLARRLESRGCPRGKIHVVRNGYGGTIFPASVPVFIDSRLRIGYIGTISDWIDFPAMLFCLDHLPDLEFHLIGPHEGKLPEHPRLILRSPINHSDLAKAVEIFNGMIVPFRKCALVEAIDPIKLYDYVNFGKAIFSVYYPELDRYSHFLNFYRTPEELLASLLSFRNKPYKKFTEKERHELLLASSWSHRANELAAIINTQIAGTRASTAGILN